MRGLHLGALALGVLAFSTAARPGQAQNGAPPTTARSVLSGVYTGDQATRGEATFRQVCVACHAYSEFARPGFLAAWEGARIFDLFELIRTTMPQDEPGTLSPASYADILAYLLRLNRFPPGDRDLPAEPDSLRQIRMEPLSAPQAEGPRRTTLSGVYSALQAAQGQDRYAAMCQGCHNAASHTGAAFVSAWAGRALWDLFDYIMANMPKSEPGILTAGECTELVAYLLKINGLPAGPDDLPADSVELKAIRFATAAVPRGGAGTR